MVKNTLFTFIKEHYKRKLLKTDTHMHTVENEKKNIHSAVKSAGGFNKVEADV